MYIFLIKKEKRHHFHLFRIKRKKNQRRYNVSTPNAYWKIRWLKKSAMSFYFRNFAIAATAVADAAADAAVIDVDDESVVLSYLKV